MQQVRIWVNKITFPKMIEKVMEKVSEPNQRYPRCANVNRYNCDDYILNVIKAEVEKYCLKPHADLEDEYLSFDFGSPLNDIIFKLIPNRYPEFENPLPPTAVCNVKYHAGKNTDFELEFYQVAF